MTSEPASPSGGVASTAAFRRAIRPAALAGAVALVLAGLWWVLTRPETTVPLAPVAATWGVALVAAVVVSRRRNPVTLSSITAQLLALLGSAVIFGAFRGSLSGVLAGVAGLVFFVSAVGSTLLRADGAPPRRRSAFD